MIEMLTHDATIAAFRSVRELRFALAIACLFSSATLAATEPPNMLVILVDDLGFGDLSSFWRLTCNRPISID